MSDQYPLRVDFAGGWLDVPKLAQPGSYTVNCAISPCVGIDWWPYHQRSGLGGSAAYDLINGRDPYAGEAGRGVGWQDPAVILHGGLCCWRSGAAPELDWTKNGSRLKGRMLLLWTGKTHDTAQLVDCGRSYRRIVAASRIAQKEGSLDDLALAMDMTYTTQLVEGMHELPGLDGAIARKYCGSGHGGYAFYLFADVAARDAAADANPATKKIEPFSWKVKANGMDTDNGPVCRAAGD